MDCKPIVKYSLDNLFLAPMAGFTDQAFCEICLNRGADMTFTEMVSAEALCRRSQKSYDMAKPASNASYHAIQLFGADPQRVAQAIEEIADLNPAWIDLNCGCPVSKVIKTGAGSALLKDPLRIQAMMESMRETIENRWGAKSQGKGLDSSVTKPILSVKIRSGWDAAHQNFLDVAKAAIDGGADWVTLHPRTRSAGYGGEANWLLLEQLVKAVDGVKSKAGKKVGICGSGDLFTAVSGYQMLETTGCDAIMYARGAEGNPWIFRQTKSLLKNFPFEKDGGMAWGEEKKKLLEESLLSIEPTLNERVETAISHLQLACALHGESVGVRSMRKQISSYIRGIANAKEIRNRLMSCATFEECRLLLLTLMDYR